MSRLSRVQLELLESLEFSAGSQLLHNRVNGVVVQRALLSGNANAVYYLVRRGTFGSLKENNLIEVSRRYDFPAKASSALRVRGIGLSNYTVPVDDPRFWDTYVISPEGRVALNQARGPFRAAYGPRGR